MGYFPKRKKPENSTVSGLSGVPGEIRTPDLPLRRRTLYPAELRKQVFNYPLKTTFSETNVDRLGGERSILLSYGDKYAVVAARGSTARQEELYRSGGMIVNQSGNKRGAAGGNLIPLGAIGAAVRRMVKLRQIYARRVDRALTEDFDALRIDLVVMSRRDEQRRAVDLV